MPWGLDCTRKRLMAEVAAQSGKGRLLTGPPRTTRHAGPHRAVHEQEAHVSLMRILVACDKSGTPAGDFHPINSCPCRAYTLAAADVCRRR